MYSVLIIGFSVFSIVHTFTLPSEGLRRLDVIHFNDFHARFEETSQSYLSCRNNVSCYGGLARMVYKIKALKKEKPNAIVLNAGDSFQGTYWYTLLKWFGMQEYMNFIPHDAHAIGNHDFDDGPEGLAPYLAYLKAPVVAANMDASKEPILQGLYKPYVIVERGDLKIGIIGLITPDTEILAHSGNVEFTDPLKAAAQESKALNEQGVDIIVILSHCGYDVDLAIARDYGHYIDLIVGGHTHRDESYIKPYLTKLRTKNTKHEVIVVQVDAFTKFVGDLSIYFDIHGDYVKWEGGPIFLNRSIPEDEEIKSKLKPLSKLIHDAEQKVVGYAYNDMRHEDCGFGECLVGDLLCDAINDYAKENVKSKYDHISFIQRSNIKASLPKGNIVQGSIVELFPYRDLLETFELQGKYVIEALERSVSDARTSPVFNGPWLLQVSGLRVLYNTSQPENHRLNAAYVGKRYNVLLNPGYYYQVTLPMYIATGGDGYKMFANHKKNPKTIGSDRQALRRYIEKTTPINIYKEKRIIIMR